MTITIGWWLAPLAVTIVSLVWVAMQRPEHGTYSVDIVPLFVLAAALIASLAAWLAWALLA